MKRFVIILVIIIAAIAGFIVLSPKASETDTKQANQPSQALSFAKIQQDVANGAELYDVRTPEEYLASHFQNAANLPLQTLQAGSMPDVAKDTKIYVYCRSGSRSAQATAILQQNGYSNVTDLHGLSDVINIGGKLISG